MNTLALIGYILAGSTFVIVVGLFVFLVIKQEKLKKLPVWFYILAVLGLLIGLAAIVLVITGNVQKSLGI